MIGLSYLGALAVSLGGLALVDRRYRLAFWHDARRSALVLVVGVVFFLAWDLVGIGLGIFVRGPSPHMTGLHLAPELPVEEAVFLTLLCYTTLVVWRWVATRPARRADAPAGTRGGEEER